MGLPWLYYVFLLVHVITVLVGGFRYKSLPRPLRVLEWLIFISLVDTIFQMTLAFYDIHNLWTMHCFTIIEFTFVVILYSSWIKNRRYQSILFLCLVGFVVLWIVSKFSFEPFSLADDGTSSISKILQIAFSAYLLVDIVKESDLVWKDDPRLWVVVSILIYAAGSLFWFALFNKMLQISPERLRQTYFLNWILMIISNLLFLRAFLCKK
jgi:hypothetical protein